MLRPLAPAPGFGSRSVMRPTSGGLQKLAQEVAERVDEAQAYGNMVILEVLGAML